MAKTNYYILLNKNGNMITIDHKLPIYWNKSVALKDKEKFGADKIISIRIDYLKNLLNPSATSEYLKNNAKKIINKRKKLFGRYYYNIYFNLSDGNTCMQRINANSYKEAKKIFIKINGKELNISHYKKD
ncbi:MAG: hypothetical protein IPJ01_11340 [Micavibrio sp.]|nr:hypothetical protein [Micavibrio sp.]